jgi:hypothetical protein
MYITIVAALTVAGFPECKISRGAVSVLTGLDGLRVFGVGHERRAPCFLGLESAGGGPLGAIKERLKDRTQALATDAR